MDVMQRFMSISQQFSAHPAVVVGADVTAYAELAQMAGQCAAQFKALMPCPRFAAPHVLINVPAGPEAYAAMLGALLCGGAYTPLSPGIPASKMHSIATRLAPTILLGGDGGKALADGTNLFWAGSAERAALEPLTLPRHGERAYVIFTSGSTGEPKGVEIPRSALSHYVDWTVEALRLEPSDRVSQTSQIGFDLSVLEIYATLCSGAALYPPRNALDRLRPGRFIARAGLTTWISVPSAIGLIITGGDMTEKQMRSVRQFVHCGEALLAHHVEAIFAACPDADVLNTYGPTEATVSMTENRLNRDNFRANCAGSVALGTPIAGMRLDLVGGPSAREGEIVITGPQVALGYLADPQRTAQAFTLGAQRSYRTGDWAERRADGRLYFKQRLDHQVKVRGYRIELDEVENALGAVGYPLACAFVANNVLVAVIPPEPPITPAALRRALKPHLEDYKIPTHIAVITQVPRNASDKIDRRAVQSWWLARHGPQDNAQSAGAPSPPAATLPLALPFGLS